MTRTVDKNDAYLDLRSPRENSWGAVVREGRDLVLKLVECEVLDANRLAYFNGTWWRPA